MTQEKGGHKCSDNYRRYDGEKLICSKCGKDTPVKYKPNPFKDFITNIDDGIDLNDEI